MTPCTRRSPSRYRGRRSLGSGRTRWTPRGASMRGRDPPLSVARCRGGGGTGRGGCSAPSRRAGGVAAATVCFAAVRVTAVRVTAICVTATGGAAAIPISAVCVTAVRVVCVATAVATPIGVAAGTLGLPTRSRVRSTSERLAMATANTLRRAASVIGGSGGAIVTTLRRGPAGCSRSGAAGAPLVWRTPLGRVAERACLLVDCWRVLDASSSRDQL